MRKAVKLLVVHDRDLIRAGLVALLNERREFQVVAEVASLDKKALRLVRTSKPDVVIMDLDSVALDGLEAPAQLRKISPTTHVLMLVNLAEGEVFAALAAQADGYCAREASFDRVLAAIRAVSKGEFWLDSTVSKKVVQALLETMAILSGETDDEEDGDLTQRELECLSLVSRGLSNTKIAEQIGISAETVKSHIRKIMKKLVVRDRTQAAVKALKRGII